jgi:hypothetical protein
MQNETEVKLNEAKSEAKRKRQSEISGKQYIFKRNEGKTASITEEKKNKEANQSEKKNTEAKNEAKENYGSETKQNEKYRNGKRSKKKNTEAKQSEKKSTEAIRKIRKRNEAKRKIWEAKRSEKIYAKFSLKHAKRKGNESRFVSFGL